MWVTRKWLHTCNKTHFIFPSFPGIFDDVWTVRLRHCHAFSFHMRVTNFAVDIITGRKRGVSQLPQNPEPWLYTYRNLYIATYSHTILVWLRLQTANNRQSDTKRCVKTIRYYCKMQHLRQGMVTGALLWRRWWLQPDLLYLCISSAQTMAFSFMSICTSAIVCVCVARGWICQTCSHMGRYRQNKKNNNVGKSTCCSISWIKPLTWHQHIN